MFTLDNLNEHTARRLLLLIVSLVVIFGIIRLAFPYNPGWDESVYIGMGKYIATNGEIGLTESLRPPIIPLLFALFYLIGPQILLAQVFELLTFIGIIILVYLLGNRIFSTGTGLLAAILVATSGILVQYSGRLMTEIPAAFFLLLGLLLFFEGHFFLAGFSSALAFLTKFPLGIALLAFAFGLHYYRRQIINFLIGGLIPISAYLISNYVEYRNVFWPFIIGNQVISNAGLWIYGHGISYYAIVIPLISISFAFLIPALYWIVTDGNWRMWTVTSSAGLVLAYLMSIAHKEDRFLLLILPILFIISSYGICRTFVRQQKSLQLVFGTLLFINILTGFLLYTPVSPTTPAEFVTNYYQHSATYTGSIYATNPLFAAYLDRPIHVLYYPDFTQERVEELFAEMTSPSRIYTSTCDIPCNPTDETCLRAQENLFERLEKTTQRIATHYLNSCEFIIWET